MKCCAHVPRPVNQSNIADGAGAEQFRLEIEPDRPQVRLRFRDDGPGWPEVVLAGKHQKIGLKLVRPNVTEAF